MEFITEKQYKKEIDKNVRAWKKRFKKMHVEQEKVIKKHINPFDLKVENMWDELDNILSP